jgi:hypothetical protein
MNKDQDIWLKIGERINWGLTEHVKTWANVTKVSELGYITREVIKTPKRAWTLTSSVNKYITSNDATMTERLQTGPLIDHVSFHSSVYLHQLAICSRALGIFLEITMYLLQTYFVRIVLLHTRYSWGNISLVSVINSRTEVRENFITKYNLHRKY